MAFDPNDPNTWIDDRVEGAYGQYPGEYKEPFAWDEALAGDPRYNERQSVFEDQTNWGRIAGDLKREAASRGVEWDQSDVLDIQRNSGYDAAHRGSSEMYAQNIDKWYQNALKKYDERAANTPGQASGSGGAGGGSKAGAQLRQPSVNYSAPGGPGPNQGPINQVGQDPFSSLLTNSIGELLENRGMFDEGRMAMRQEAGREALDRNRKAQLAMNRGELADRNLLSVPGIAQGQDISSIMKLDERLAPAYAASARDLTIQEMESADDRLVNALGLGTARQAMLGQLALEQLNQNMQWNMFLAQFGLDRDQLMYDIQNGSMDRLIPLLQLFGQMVQTSAAGQAGG